MSSGVWLYLIPFGVNLAVAIVAYVLHWLTLSGALSALLVGFFAFRFTGIGVGSFLCSSSSPQIF